MTPTRDERIREEMIEWHHHEHSAFIAGAKFSDSIPTPRELALVEVLEGALETIEFFIDANDISLEESEAGSIANSIRAVLIFYENIAAHSQALDKQKEGKG